MDISKMNVTELKDACTKRGLKIGRPRPGLVKALKDYLAKNPTDELASSSMAGKATVNGKVKDGNKKNDKDGVRDEKTDKKQDDAPKKKQEESDFVQDVIEKCPLLNQCQMKVQNQKNIIIAAPITEKLEKDDAPGTAYYPGEMEFHEIWAKQCLLTVVVTKTKDYYSMTQVCGIPEVADVLGQCTSLDISNTKTSPTMTIKMTVANMKVVDNFKAKTTNLSHIAVTSEKLEADPPQVDQKSCILVVYRLPRSEFKTPDDLFKLKEHFRMSTPMCLTQDPHHESLCYCFLVYEFSANARNDLMRETNNLKFGGIRACIKTLTPISGKVQACDGMRTEQSIMSEAVHAFKLYKELKYFNKDHAQSKQSAQTLESKKTKIIWDLKKSLSLLLMNAKYKQLEKHLKDNNFSTAMSRFSNDIFKTGTPMLAKRELDQLFAAPKPAEPSKAKQDVKTPGTKKDAKAKQEPPKSLATAKSSAPAKGSTGKAGSSTGMVPGHSNDARAAALVKPRPRAGATSARPFNARNRDQVPKPRKLLDMDMTWDAPQHSKGQAADREPKPPHFSKRPHADRQPEQPHRLRGQASNFREPELARHSREVMDDRWLEPSHRPRGPASDFEELEPSHHHRGLAADRRPEPPHYVRGQASNFREPEPSRHPRGQNDDRWIEPAHRPRGPASDYQEPEPSHHPRGPGADRWAEPPHHPRRPGPGREPEARDYVPSYREPVSAQQYDEGESAPMRDASSYDYGHTRYQESKQDFDVPAHARRAARTLEQESLSEHVPRIPHRNYDVDVHQERYDSRDVDMQREEYDNRDRDMRRERHAEWDAGMHHERYGRNPEAHGERFDDRDIDMRHDAVSGRSRQMEPHVARGRGKIGEREEELYGGHHAGNSHDYYHGSKTQQHPEPEKQALNKLLHGLSDILSNELAMKDSPSSSSYVEGNYAPAGSSRKRPNPFSRFMEEEPTAERDYWGDAGHAAEDYGDYGAETASYGKKMRADAGNNYQYDYQL